MQNYNPEDIILRLKKPPKMAFVCLISAIVMFVLAIVGIIMMIIGNDLGFVLIFCGIPFGLLFIGLYVVKIIKSKNALKNVNFDIVRAELMGGCMAYNNSVFFTQNYLIANHYTAFVTSYMDIIWIYQVDKYANGVYCGADLSINLVTGKKGAIPYSNQFVDEIRKHNPVVLVGVSNENKNMYRQKVDEYKKYSATTNGMTYQQVNNQVPQNYKPMSAEDPIYQFNQISKEMREAQNPSNGVVEVQTPMQVQETPSQTQAPVQQQAVPQVPVQQQVVQQVVPQVVQTPVVQEAQIPIETPASQQQFMPQQPVMEQVQAPVQNGFSVPIETSQNNIQ